MFSLIIAELQSAVVALEQGNLEGHAFHTGKAGGVSASIGAFGIKALSLCDDISNAYETGDKESLDRVLQEATERPDYAAKPDAMPSIFGESSSEGVIGWEESGAALRQAVEAKNAGDDIRYSLMIGFASGLLFRNPGPSYDRGTIPDAITAGYETSDSEQLDWAGGRLAAAHRLSTPMSFLSGANLDRYVEAKVRTTRWAQNFGLRNARATDESVLMPNAFWLNWKLARQSQHDA